ncbi:MAG: tyrosine-protein phosphatase, partial [Sphingobium sp.]
MTTKIAAATIAALMLATAIPFPASALVSDATAERDAAGQVVLHWTAKGPVDVLQADSADAGISAARLVSKGDRDGTAAVAADPVKRPYFLLKDSSDGSVTRVAERLVPLKQGSNFRDIGGYPGANGKHVRWGLIYRAGATAMLTPEDVSTVNALGLRQMVDLRSDEERVLAPTKIDGVTYTAHGYSMQRIFDSMKSQTGSPQNGGQLYRG